ncbi:hypothetical protein BDFB_007186 [Asbolus verrucosus]|uniref:Uncharacterized protein n=1 Tax=Asbolus verrucosus TaxID=1661398 RepID=A0A482VVV9_ASBVE|nr:hypothetical protein BDFB_007186 [Asbolus verrucosus]
MALSAPAPEPVPKAKPGLVAAAYTAPAIAAPAAYSATYAPLVGYVAPAVYNAGYTAYSPYTGSLVVV